MPPRSPLPPVGGLQAAWVRTPDRGKESPTWVTLRDLLLQKLAVEAPVEEMLAAGRFVFSDGTPLTGDEDYSPHTFIWFHRDRRLEPVVPFEVEVLHQDERLVVVDKPHFLSSIPRGKHVMESVVVRIRETLNLPEASPAHRLDRLTAGVLVLTTGKQWRAPYQTLFERREVEKVYEALAPVRPELVFPQIVRNQIVKEVGIIQAKVLDDKPPNAETLVELAEIRGEIGRYVLRPKTGKTHQLRIQLCGLGIPILGDPWYPEVLNVNIDDFSTPLQLIARELSFTDPIDGAGRSFTSERELDWPTP